MYIYIYIFSIVQYEILNLIDLKNILLIFYVRLNLTS